MDQELVIVDNTVRGNKTITETVECDGKILIKHYYGSNCENYLLITERKRLLFSIFRLNNIHYINLNGEHIIEYNKFTNINYVRNDGNCVIINNAFVGDIILNMCDISLVEKALTILDKEMKRRIKWYNELAYYIFN